MQKTNKSIAKRFKITGNGRVMRRSPNAGHLRSNKTTKQKRSYRQDKPVSPGFSKHVKAAVLSAL